METVWARPERWSAAPHPSLLRTERRPPQPRRSVLAAGLGVLKHRTPPPDTQPPCLWLCPYLRAFPVGPGAGVGGGGGAHFGGAGRWRTSLPTCTTARGA